MTRAHACVLVVTLLIASRARAQGLDHATAGIPRRVACAAARPTSEPCASDFPGQVAFSAADGWAVLSSAVVPGSGQALQGSHRALAFLAIEAFAWTSYIHHSQQYRRRRDGYRDLASRVARHAFSTYRPHGDFEYYERMTHYPASGSFDLVPGGGIDPETDSTTYNGAVWLLARRTYWSDPFVPPDMNSAEWLRAMTFYQERAYDQLYRWSWVGTPKEYSDFMTLIARSNDANRRAMVDLGVIIANHVLSTIDAYITVRLRRDSTRGDLSLTGAVPLRR